MVKSHCPTLHVKVDCPGEGSFEWAAANSAQGYKTRTALENHMPSPGQFPGSMILFLMDSFKGFPEAVSGATFDVGLL